MSNSSALTASLLGLVIVQSQLDGAGFESMVHHWNFDEGPDWHDDAFGSVSTATVINDRVGSADASFQGMSGSSFVSGRQYTGLAFDGVDDSLLTASDLGATLGGTASLSFWIKTIQTGSADPASAPGLLGTVGVQWGWIDDAGRISFGVDGDALASSANPINDNRWHHVVMTRDAASGLVEIHVDGTLSASATGAVGTRSGSMTRVGWMQNGSGVRFQGTLDQVHVFNGVVDAPTLVALHDNHAPKTWDISSGGESSGAFSTASVLVSSSSYDAEQDPLTVVSFTQPAQGSVIHNGDGSFTYTPSGGFTGSDPFTVVITDGRGGFTEVEVEVLVKDSPPAGSQNRTTTFEDFQAINAGGVPIAHSGWRVPRAIDWNADGKMDFMVGDDSGIWRYQNTGTVSAPTFAAGVKVQAAGVDISLSGNILIALADMTGDGVDDLVAVNGERTVRIYENTASAGQVPVYAAATTAPSTAGGNFVLPDQRFDAADWNGDGLIDLVMGEWSGELRAYLNVGTAAAPSFNPANYEVLESGSYNLYPRVFDINRNGIPDYIRAINWGSINFWFDPALYAGLGSQSGSLTITDTLGSPVSIKPVTDGAMVDFADFNGDDVFDLLVGGHAGSETFIAFGVANTVADSIAQIEAIYDAHPTGLGAALEANSQALLNEIKGAESNIITQMQASTLGERQTQFAQMVAHVGKYSFLQMGAPVDTVEYDHLPSIAGQNLMTMHQMLPDTAAHRTNVANAVGLTGTHRDVYLQMGLHVGDNQEATAGMIESVRDFMVLQPRESFPDAAITLNHYRGNGRGGWVNSFRGAKNTFDFGIGNNSTEWAGDLNAAAVAFYGEEVQRGDYFTFVMGHEVTHSLDGYVSGRANKDLWRRKGQMLTLAAGPDVLSSNSDNNEFWDWNVTKARFQAEGHWDGVAANWDTAWADYWTTGPGAAYESLSFMRGNIDWFLGASQEAMATQANHHWAHGEARLIGAIDRWQRGVDQGIDPMKANLTEVLTFLDWISCGMNKIVMQDTKGVSTPYARADFSNTTHAWVERDDNGFITSLTTSGRTYEFAVDGFGVVTALLDVPAFQENDEVSVIQNTPNLIRPLDNDQNNGGTLSIAAFTQPANGTVVDEGNGVLVYTPNPGFTGADGFTYSTGPTVPASTVSILVSPATSAQAGILTETWNGISGTSVSNLTSATAYPLNPDSSEVLSLFETASNRGSDFGTRMTALLIPPASGDYTFWVASDDNGELWLSTDRSDKNKSMIASVSGWAGPREWSKFSSQQSAIIPLVAGQPYYIEVRHKEGGGGDNLAVAWQGPGITQDVIPGSALQTVDLNAPFVANAPANVVVVEDAAPLVVDVSSVFGDSDLQDTVSLSLSGNSNPSLVSSSLVGNDLTLSFAPDQFGVATITLRAADLGGALTTTTFDVTVQSDLDGDGDPDVTDPDDDGDGMTDVWEVSYGLDPLVDDSGGNQDGDQFTNGQEFVADTDPTDGSSFLTMTVSAVAAGQSTLSFQSSLGRQYTVEYRDELGSGTWMPLGSSVAGDGNVIDVVDAAAGGPYRFYRLRVELP